MKRSFTTKKTFLSIIGGIFFIISVIAIAVFLLIGKTNISGNITSDIVSNSTVCSNESAYYKALPFKDDMPQKILVNLIFKDKIIDTIGLLLTVIYSSESEARFSWINAEIAFSELATSSGLPSEGALNSKFSLENNRLELSLYAKRSDINEKTAPLLMLTNNSKNISEMTSQDYINNYENQGFTCKENR